MVHWLKSHGFHSAERSVQYCGRNGDSSDVRVPNELPNLYIEVKSRKLNPPVSELQEWLDVAAANAGGKVPILLVNVLRAREPAVYGFEPVLGGIIGYVTNKIETLIRLNQQAAAERPEREVQ